MRDIIPKFSSPAAGLQTPFPASRAYKLPSLRAGGGRGGRGRPGAAGDAYVLTGRDRPVDGEEGGTAGDADVLISGGSTCR